MSDLASWLLEQITEDERVIAEIEDSDDDARESRGATEGLAWINPSNQWNDTWRLTIPASRVLAECAAKRAIIEEHGAMVMPYAESGYIHHCAECATEFAPCRTLRHLATAYADRPGYREEWRP